MGARRGSVYLFALSCCALQLWAQAKTPQGTFRRGESFSIKLTELKVADVVSLTARLVSADDEEFAVYPTSSQRKNGSLWLTFGLPDGAPLGIYKLTDIEYEASGFDTTLTSDLDDVSVVIVK